MIGKVSGGSSPTAILGRNCVGYAEMPNLRQIISQFLVLPRVSSKDKLSKIFTKKCKQEEQELFENKYSF